MADPNRTMLDRADVGPVVAPAAHSHGKGEIGSHADSHAEGGSDPVSPGSIGAATKSDVQAHDTRITALESASPAVTVTDNGNGTATIASIGG